MEYGCQLESGSGKVKGIISLKILNKLLIAPESGC